MLRAALRDYEIYAQFCGNNIDELIEKYGLTQSHIYDILRKQRQLHRRRYQPDMLDALE
ncbi:Mor transcription activator family protein [Leminorella grimontii]|uniref:Mor transcription activator family protein n=1 Tax=Leminorella grimontii TaxID=82981 RepID=UPI0021005DDD|nr:Mor transcription activator family protein [Leminorella grimontii]